MRPPHARIELWLAALPLLAGACSSQPIAPVTDAGIEAEASVVQCGPALLSGSDCESCAMQSCCAQAKACKNDPACAAHLSCLDACDPADHACSTACAPASDAGSDDLLGALRTCELVHCQPQCPFGALACGGLSSPVPACDTCLTAQCCTEESAVGTDGDAMHYAECAARCAPSDAPCRDTCASQHTGGWLAARALEACTEQKCVGTCANPAVDCVGNVQQAPLVKTAIVYGFKLVEYTTGIPLDSATVKLCDRADVACTSPLAAGATDPNGQVGFYLPVSSPGFSGFAEVSALGYYPTLIVQSAPLVDDTFVGAGIPLLSTGATLAKQAGTSLDTSRATFALTAVGCDGTTLPYVAFAVDTADGASTMYYVGPNVGTATGPVGLGIAFNVPVGSAAVVAKFPLTGQVVSSVSNVPTRAGTVTEIRLTPN